MTFEQMAKIDAAIIESMPAFKSISFVNRDSEEWNMMWRTLSRHSVNSGLTEPLRAEDPESGEIWQYMGTVGGWHEFRHRRHPVTKIRELLRIESCFLSAGA